MLQPLAHSISIQLWGRGLTPFCAKPLLANLVLEPYCHNHLQIHNCGKPRIVYELREGPTRKFLSVQLRLGLRSQLCRSTGRTHPGYLAQRQTSMNEVRTEIPHGKSRRCHLALNSQAVTTFIVQRGINGLLNPRAVKETLGGFDFQESLRN